MSPIFPIYEEGWIRCINIAESPWLSLQGVLKVATVSSCPRSRFLSSFFSLFLPPLPFDTFSASYNVLTIMEIALKYFAMLAN